MEIAIQKVWPDEYNLTIGEYSWKIREIDDDKWELFDKETLLWKSLPYGYKMIGVINHLHSLIEKVD